LPGTRGKKSGGPQRDTDLRQLSESKPQERKKQIFVGGRPNEAYDKARQREQRPRRTE